MTQIVSQWVREIWARASRSQLELGWFAGEAPRSLLREPAAPPAPVLPPAPHLLPGSFRLSTTGRYTSLSRFSSSGVRSTVSW